MYLLKWTSTITGNSGNGTHAFPDRRTIDYYISMMNNKYPHIIHTTIPAPINTPLLEINNYLDLRIDIQHI